MLVDGMGRNLISDEEGFKVRSVDKEQSYVHLVVSNHDCRQIKRSIYSRKALIPSSINSSR